MFKPLLNVAYGPSLDQFAIWGTEAEGTELKRNFDF